MTGARRAVTLALVLGLAIATAACGRRAAPIAPERLIPMPVANLSAVVVNDAIELHWTNPTQRQDGNRLAGLKQLRVYRADTSAGLPAPAAILHRGRIPGYTEIATIRVATPSPATISGDAVTLVDRGSLSIGRRYSYVVLADDAQDRVSPPSRRETIAFIAAPEPPHGLVAEATEGEVQLRWDPTERLVDGTEPDDVTYEVLRAPAVGAPLAPLPGEPSTERTFVDRSVANDHTYQYAVRAIRTAEGTRAIGEASDRVDATPLDVTPPSPPTQLAAIPSEATVRLSWLPSPDGDVVRYIVYRALGRGDFVRIGSVEPPRTVFVDRDVPSGPARYAVTAQDASLRGNESARSNTVTVSVP